MLDSIRYHLANGTRFDCLALGVAAWIRYVGGVDEQGQPIEVSDPLIEQLRALVNGSTEGEARVKALLSLNVVFGSELPKDERFVSAVVSAYQQLLELGAKEAVAQLVKKL